MSHWLQITSGRGPAECSWVVYRLHRVISEEARRNGIDVNLLEAVTDDPPETCKSVLLALEGQDIERLFDKWEGVIQWIGASPFRPHHKRKNWFVGVKGFTPPPAGLFSEKDIRVETMKASGPGGQHVNKSDTAVRITHLPTGLNASAQEERSQHLNRKLALARLAGLVEEYEKTKMKKTMREMWDAHNTLERGNPKFVFKGPRFSLQG